MYSVFTKVNSRLENWVCARSRFILGYFEIPISASQIFKEGKKLLKLESGFDIKETFTEENQSGGKKVVGSRPPRKAHFKVNYRAKPA